MLLRFFIDTLAAASFILLKVRSQKEKEKVARNAHKKEAVCKWQCYLQSGRRRARFAPFPLSEFVIRQMALHFPKRVLSFSAYIGALPRGSLRSLFQRITKNCV
jgi:hypothetical protein